MEANAAAEAEPAFAERAKELFRRLEGGDEGLARQWRLIRDGVHKLTDLLRALPHMMSASEGEGGQGKADVVGEVA